MNRRAILRYAAYATGAVIAAPLMGTFLSSCQQEIQSADVVLFFKPKELTFVKNLIDTILPKTDSPSASEVGVHDLIDSMVGTVYQAADQESYRTGFESLQKHLEGQQFSTVDAAAQLAILQQLEDPKADETVRGAYLHLKQQTITYYLSTEAIGTKFLNYLPVPGAYEPCIKLADVDGKAWAI